MRVKMEKKRGFTLIELLVVISIIGVLATLLVANFNATRLRARDAQRKADLRNIQTALRLFYNDFGYYPDSSSGQIVGCGSGGTTACAWGGNFIADQTYMNVLPADPLKPDRDYNYVRNTTEDYDLEACLENTSDEDCPQVAPMPACAGGYSGCPYNVKP